MENESSFDNLMEQLREGSEDAAQEIFDRFAQRLIGLARLRLDSRVRSKVDPEDVLQSVFKSFFMRHAGGKLDLKSWGGLWRLLVVITLRKCGRKTRDFMQAGRDVRKEVAVSPALSSDSIPDFEAIARDPTPSEAVVLSEIVEQLMAKLKERERPILMLSLQGYSAAEISTQIGRSERTVYRVLEYVKQQLERQQAAVT